MNARKLAVAGLVIAVVAVFFLGMKVYQDRTRSAQDERARAQAERLVRMHSPVLGPRTASVTIVEFFDPACETCRAFYPFVKDLMKQYPDDVRLVIRYAPFHEGSDKVVKLLEASRLQDKYLPVLERVLAAQPMWASHGAPNIELAYKAAEQAGLDLQKALADAASPAIDAKLKQDVEDLTALQVTKTPTFFVNGRALASFGPDQLAALVAEEVSKAKR